MNQHILRMLVGTFDPIHMTFGSFLSTSMLLNSLSLEIDLMSHEAILNFDQLVHSRIMSYMSSVFSLLENRVQLEPVLGLYAVLYM